MAVVVAPACGARWDDGQKASVAARYRGGTAGAAAAARTGAGAAGDITGTDTIIGADGTATTVATSGGTGGNGGLTGAAGPGGAQGASSAPCRAPSDAPGVTDREITVGSISSLSGPVPGLGASAAAAVRAQVAYRNSTGGVCGRRIVLKEADDGTDNARYRAAISQLAPVVFGIPGGFAVGDVGGGDIVDRHKLPLINSPTGRTGELRSVFDINPDFPRPDMLIGKYKYLVEQGARKVSMTYIAVDQSRLEAGIQRRLMEAAGLQVVHVNELPLSTLSYDAAARAAANSGANYLWFIADTNGQANMARSVKDSGHEWLFKEFSYTTYGTKFIELAGDAAEGATSWLRSLPTEEAGTNQAMAQYVEWMNRIAPGLPKDLFSIDSWVSAKVFFEMLEALPGPISRDALVQQLETIESYDADGMFAPITLGKDLSQGCFMGMIVRGGKWERLAPSSGYLC